MFYLLCTALLLGARDAKLPIRFEATTDGYRVVATLPARFASELPAGALTQQQGETVMAVALLGGKTKTPGPSMLGKYSRNGNELMFTPRFPLAAGACYRATFRAGETAASLDFRVPATAAKAPPRIVKIYPTVDVVPANLLRFYIYFDRPMRGGKGLFQHLAILDEKAKEIDAPWLIDEIWDEENNCLILYIHPGRIKWGVEQRGLMGPVLHEKQSYSLVVRGDWADLEGNKIGKDTIKRLRTSSEDRVRLELGDWKLTPPKAGTRDALTLTFPKSIDHRSLQTDLTVRNAKGQTIAGETAIGEGEISWRFTPAQPWLTGRHYVSISPDLEDVAGNTPSRPFDMDLLTAKRPAQKLQIEFGPVSR